MNPLISIIIPVFNTGKYLVRCIDSVLGQSLRQIEVICVDDGSTDCSSAILSSYANKDDRVMVVTNEANQGVSVARNRGLALSRGEYVYFMDSDDWIDPDYLEFMYAQAKTGDLDIAVNVNYEDDVENSRVSSFPYNKANTSNTVSGIILSLVWVKLFRRKFLMDNKLSFPEDLSASEDYYFCRLASVISEKINTFNGPMYHHVRREGSLSTTNDFDNIRAAKMLFDEFKARSLDVNGLKLFYMGLLVLDSQERFDFIRSFFEEIQPYVAKSFDLYRNDDLYCLETVLSCRDWEDFKNRYNPSMVVNFALNHLKKKSGR